MLKRLGTFALLAVCLFAIAIVMGGCGSAKLLPSYPNPFNPGTETWIPYELSEAAAVIITIHDSDRKLVRTLFLGQKPAGTYQTRDRAAHWDGRNGQGEPVASGVYYCKLTAGKFSPTTQKLFIGPGLRHCYVQGTEVWIPYHLSAPAAVTVTFHNSDGKLVRTLALGQKPAGIYETSERAAYWDGRTAQGNFVGWGTYSCTLTAGEFSATQKVELRFIEDVKEVLSVIQKETATYIEEMKKAQREEIERRKKEIERRKKEEIRRQRQQRDEKENNK